MQENDKPTIEQWKELYDAAINIRQIAPWEYLWDMDLIVIMLPGREEPVYCSVMGRNRECYAIGIYPGFKAVGSFYRMAESASNDMAAYTTGLEQECLMCHFGDREEVVQEDREVFKALGLRFRGRNEWIYFRTMEPGYYPWHIRAWEADLLIQVLQNLALAVAPLVSGEIKVDFDFGETIVRSYSQEEGLWRNEVAKRPRRLVITPQLIVDNDVLIASLRKCKRNDTCLEFDISYLPAPIRKSKDDRPYFPRFILLMSKNAGVVIDQHMADKDEAIEVDILDMLTRYILKYGKPSSINIRDDRVAVYIGDFCKKANIKLIEGKGIPVIDDFILGLMNSLS